MAATEQVNVLYSRRVEVMEGAMLLNRSLTAIAVVLACACAPVAAATTFAKGLGDATGPLVAAGIAATYFGSFEKAQAKAARVADAAVISLGVAELLKPNMNVDGAGKHLHDFPSGHTAIAFSSATSLAEFFPKQKWAFYAGAALVGWSRVESDAHSWQDVLGGAALGFAAGKWSMTSQDGLLIGRVYKF